MIAELPRLHAVTDDRVIGDGRVAARAAAMAAAAGPRLAVHLRSLMLEGRAFLALAREVQSALAPHGSWLAINGRADVARATRARMVVSGRGGLGVADVRRVAPGVLALRSVHDADDVQHAIAEGADAVIASAVCPLDARIPAIVIGGMTPANAADTIRRGACGVAAVRALWDADDPGAAASEFLAVLPGDETVGVIINGAQRRAPRGRSLAKLLGDLGLDARAVVVEHNRKIVRRDGLEAATVSDGDSIELVHFVGGG